MALNVLANLLHLWRSQRWDCRRAQRSQLALAKVLVDRARREVPFYRDTYAQNIGVVDIGDFADFQELPITGKEAIKANFPDRIVSDRVNGRSLYPVATSGTTDRVMLFHDEYKRDWDRAADLLLAFQGNRFCPGQRQMLIPPDACYERCGADEHGRVETVTSRIRHLLKAGGGQRKRAARQVIAQVLQDYFWRLKFLKSLGVDGTAIKPHILDEYIHQLKAWRPHLLSALPFYLYILAKHGGDRHCERIVTMIRPSGDKMTAVMIREIEAAFGACVRENYGTAELGTIAYDCADNRRQHLLSELFYIEFMRNGRHVGPGELGEIIITDLRNRVAPLIRYQVGDVGRYYEDPCPCGRTGLLFDVCGRIDGTIVAPGGQVFSADEVVDLFLVHPEIDYVKITQQDTARFLVDIVPSGQAGRVLSSEALSASFGEFLGYPVKVIPRKVHRIAPEGSGKYRLVISSSHNEFHSKKK